MPGIAWWSILGWCAAAAAALAVLVRVPWFRALPRTGPAWPLRAESGLLAFAGSFLLAAIAGSAVGALGERAAGAEDGELGAKTVQVLASRVAQLAAVGAAFLLRGPALHGAIAGRVPRARAESVLLACAWAALLWPIAQAAGSVAGAVEQLAGGATPALGHETLGMLSRSGPSSPWWWATVFAAVGLAPVAEELVYRGLLQQGLRAAGLGTGAAIALTSALFALMHLTVLVPGARLSGLAVLMALSIGWGVLYERTGRMAAPIVAHAAFNAANLAIALG